MNRPYAEELLFRHDFAAARAAFANAPRELRADAEVRLATLSWRYDGDFAAGLAHLDAGEAARPNASAAPAERAGLLTAKGDFAGARAAARRALDAATTPAERMRARVAFATAAWEDPTHADAAAALGFARAAVATEPGALVPSQVAFSPEPRLDLAKVIDANLGDETPHGQANLRVVQGLVAWMQAHAAEIEGLDPRRPLLPQLDRLTDAQLRAAAAAQDPFAPR